MQNIFEHFSYRIEMDKSDFAQKLKMEFLKVLLVISAAVSTISALFAYEGLLPFDTLYIVTLAIYVLSNLTLYVLMQTKENIYLYTSYIFTYSSLFTFIVMTIDVTEDAFRFIWFFLLSFAAYTLGGRKYGLYFSILIYLCVVWLYVGYELKLTWFVLVTFMASFSVFNAFMLYFLFTINTDIDTLHAQVEVEVAKREKHEQTLLRKYRMANMGEMIDAIAHQWRQPLAEVNMILLNMDEEIHNPSYISEKIVVLSELQTHMSQTIEDFRYLLQDTKKKIDFDIALLVDEVLALMKDTLETITIYKDSVSCEIYGHKNELLQVCIILLSNAKEALLLTQIENPSVYIAVSESTTACMFSFEDNAGGIEEEMLKKIFDPYVTTKEKSGGTGLGLYIAKIIVENSMGGELKVFNTEKGAKFTMEIPKQ